MRSSGERTTGQVHNWQFITAKKRLPGNSIAMGAGFDCFHERSHPENPDLGARQGLNR
jgi:D-alanyl-D-alanine dipeptidase